MGEDTDASEEPCVFVVAEPEVFECLREALGDDTVWPTRFETYVRFYADLRRSKLPLERPAVVVTSDSLPGGPDSLAVFVDDFREVMVLLRWQDDGERPEGVAAVPRPVTEGRVVHAIWQVLGWAEAGEPLPEPDGSPEIAPVLAPAPVAVAVEPEPQPELEPEPEPEPEPEVAVDEPEPAPEPEPEPELVQLDDEEGVDVESLLSPPRPSRARPVPGRVLAVTTTVTLRNATTAAVAVALGARLSLRVGSDVCVAGLDHASRVIGTLVSARRPTLADLLAGVAEHDEVDHDQVLRYLVRDNASGVRALLPGPVDAGDVEPALWGGLLTALTRDADVVLVDVPLDAAATEVGARTLAAADGIVLVYDADDLPADDHGGLDDRPGVHLAAFDADAPPPDDVDERMLLLPTVWRDALGPEPPLRYVPSGVLVEETLDAALTALLPDVELAPTPVEREFWEELGGAMRSGQTGKRGFWRR